MTQQSVPAARAATAHVRMAPRFDAHEVEAFVSRLSTVRGDVVVDMSEVRFLDASGVNALLAGRLAAIERGRELFVSRLSQAARITLEMGQLDEAFPRLDGPSSDQVAA